MTNRSTPSKLLSTFLLSLAVIASCVGNAYAVHGEIGDEPTQTFQSMRSRAEVHAEAVEAAKNPQNGEAGDSGFAQASSPTSGTQQATKQPQPNAARSHTSPHGEAS